MVIITFLTIAGSLVALYTRNQSEVIKIKVELLELRNLISVNTRDIKTNRKENREDHQIMFRKLDSSIYDQKQILIKQNELLSVMKIHKK